MKRLNPFFIALITVLVLSLAILALPTDAQAQSVPRDPNGTVVPYVGHSWESLTMACSADTVWTEVTIPDGAYEMMMIPSAAIKIAADSVYAASNNTEAAVSDTTAWISVPVWNMTTFWIRRASAGTAANLYMIFKKW